MVYKVVVNMFAELITSEEGTYILTCYMRNIYSIPGLPWSEETCYVLLPD